MDLQQEYEQCCKRLEELKKQIKDAFGFKPRQLVKDSNGKHYRFSHVYVKDDGTAEIVVDEIKNRGINWRSCSGGRFGSKDELEIVEWAFDSERADELYQIISDSDSVSEVSAAKQELESLYLSCRHDWQKNGDEYHCTECGMDTETEKTSDWLNGETENSNIALDIA